MLIKKPDDIKSSEITPERDYMGRRQFIAAAGVAAAGLTVSGRVASAMLPARERQEDKPNTWQEITSYNNYYEF
jgi:sulfoxide reductase catalytic subunit YedY